MNPPRSTLARTPISFLRSAVYGPPPSSDTKASGPSCSRAGTVGTRVRPGRRATWLAIALCLAALASPAVASAATIDFDTYPGGGAVPPGPSIGDQWMSLGVVFSDAAGGPVGASNNSCSLSSPNHAYAATIVARFVDPSTGSQALTAYAGTAQDNCWVPGEGIAMRAYGLNGELLGSVFNSGSGHFESFSFSSAVIARVEMDCILQGIDNFVFDAPTVVNVDDRSIPFALGLLANPSSGGRLTVSFSLPGPSAARLDLLDVGGRRVASLEVGSLGAGRHQVRLGEDRPLHAGLYFVRLCQGRDIATARVAILP